MKHLKRISSSNDYPQYLCINKNLILIGRDKDKSDWVLSSDEAKSYISRIHARIVRTNNGDYTLYDDSKNGVFRNHVKIENYTLLNDGDLITFGHPFGERIKEGERVRQPDSPYQYVFEDCSCVIKTEVLHNSVKLEKSYLDLTNFDNNNSSKVKKQNFNIKNNSPKNNDKVVNTNVHTIDTNLESDLTSNLATFQNSSNAVNKVCSDFLDKKLEILDCKIDIKNLNHASNMQILVDSKNNDGKGSPPVEKSQLTGDNITEIDTTYSINFKSVTESNPIRKFFDMGLENNIANDSTNSDTDVVTSTFKNSIIDKKEKHTSNIYMAEINNINEDNSINIEIPIKLDDVSEYLCQHKNVSTSSISNSEKILSKEKQSSDILNYNNDVNELLVQSNSFSKSQIMNIQALEFDNETVPLFYSLPIYNIPKNEIKSKKRNIKDLDDRMYKKFKVDTNSTDNKNIKPCSPLSNNLTENENKDISSTTLKNLNENFIDKSYKICAKVTQDFNTLDDINKFSIDSLNLMNTIVLNENIDCKNISSEDTKEIATLSSNTNSKCVSYEPDFVKSETLSTNINLVNPPEYCENIDFVDLKTKTPQVVCVKVDENLNVTSDIKTQHKELNPEDNKIIRIVEEQISHEFKIGLNHSDILDKNACQSPFNSTLRVQSSDFDHQILEKDIFDQNSENLIICNSSEKPITPHEIYDNKPTSQEKCSPTSESSLTKIDDLQPKQDIDRSLSPTEMFFRPLNENRTPRCTKSLKRKRQEKASSSFLDDI